MGSKAKRFQYDVEVGRWGTTKMLNTILAIASFPSFKDPARSQDRRQSQRISVVFAPVLFE